MTDGPWAMHAGIQRGNRPAPGDDPAEVVYCDMAADARFARAHGHSDPVRVEVSEDPAGPYWGWLGNGAPEPIMIYRRRVMFEVCFPYTPQDEERAGRGCIVRLAVRAAG